VADAAALDEIVGRLGDVLTDCGRFLGLAAPAAAGV